LAEGAEGQIIIEPDNPKNVLVKKISLVVDGEVKHSMELPGFFKQNLGKNFQIN
jgi:hypothetical protein